MSTPKATYVVETDSLAIYWTDGPAAHATEAAPGLVVSFDEDDNVIGIEIEGEASVLLDDFVRRAKAIQRSKQ